MSEIKVNKISPRTACGTTTLGDSGDTFTIPAGVTITNSGTAAGFGATGSASWNTTVKTSTFTAVAGEGYFVNTTGGAVTVNLPAGTAGAVVAVKDYAGTFDTNNCILVQNGSDKIGGLTINGTLSIEGLAVTLVFIDSTQGWLITDDGLQSQANQAEYIVATGGTITCCGDYKIHTFTGPGTFCVSTLGNPVGGPSAVDYLVVAGGGGGMQGGGYGGTGGGGAGGYRESSGAASGCYTASPLGACVSALPVTVQGYPITVGAGGVVAAAPTVGYTGLNSVFSTITSTGGGAGKASSPFNADGGSGGGGKENVAGGSGNTPPVSPPQGNNGGSSVGQQGGSGGGGATVVGSNSFSTSFGGDGGAGATSSINGTPTTRAGGGGGGAQSGADTSPNPASGGSGGGGAGGAGPGPDGSMTAGGDGTINTGGGAGSSRGPTAGSGGSGIVIIRYKFQN